MLAKLCVFEKQINSAVSGETSPEQILQTLKASDLLKTNLDNVCHIISSQLSPNKVSDNLFDTIHQIYEYTKLIDANNDFCTNLVKYLELRQLTLLFYSNAIDNSFITTKMSELGNSFYNLSFDQTIDRDVLRKTFIDKDQRLLSCIKVDKEELKNIIFNGASEGSIKDIIRKDDIDELVKKQEAQEFDPEDYMDANEFNIKDVNGHMKPIDFAAICGSINCFKYLLINAAPGKEILKDKVYPIIGGNLEIIRMLIDRGFDFNDTISLKYAIKYNRTEIVEWIIDNNPSIFDDKSDSITILQQAIVSYRVEIFNLIMSYISTETLFSFPSQGDSFAPFYLDTIEKLDKNKMDDLNVFISKGKYGWFKEEWYPKDKIDSSMAFSLIINCIQSNNSDNICGILSTNPQLSQQEEEDLYNKGGTCLEALLKFERFWKYAKLPFNSFRIKVNNNNIDFLPLFTIPGFANNTDCKGNNYLQYMFKNIYPSDVLHKKDTNLEIIVKTIAKATDLSHKNKKGETASDILAKREFYISTLIMQATYREIDSSFPFQQFDECTNNGNDEYIMQPFYRCSVCNLDGNLGCCEVCAKKCHENHPLEYVGIRNAFCDCRCNNLRRMPLYI